MSASEHVTVGVDARRLAKRRSVGKACGSVVLTFALTWGLWIPVLLANPDAGP